MRFDTVIIGGGLSSLVCGIRLQKAGRKCLIVSSGQNALHFSSGTFGLLSRLPDGTPVDRPLKAMEELPSGHPYSKIGIEAVRSYLAQVPPFFKDCGIELYHGADEEANGYRMTPSGSLKPAWFSLTDNTLNSSADVRFEGKALIVNFAGFLDFNTSFVAAGFEKRGASCRIETVRHPAVERLRVNPSEMRSVNIARVMDREDNWKQFVNLVKEKMHGEDMVILPEVFGFGNPSVMLWICEMIPAKVIFVGTMPPSVPGMRAQLLLKKAFEEAGGTFLPGDEAVSAEVEDGRISCIRTANLGKVRLESDCFVLASGNLFGKGLVTTPERVYEPVFGLDVEYPSDRTLWYDSDFSSRQEYLGFGVRTDSSFRALRGGEVVPNLFVIGSELAGCNTLAEGSGAMVAILSALKVSDEILQ